MMLESDKSLYPLKEYFKALGYAFAYGVHGMSGINKWMRVVSEKDKVAPSLGT